MMLNRYEKTALAIFLNLLFIVLLIGCSTVSEKNELFSLPIETIERIDVANGTTGEFVLLEKESTYASVLQLIHENRFILKSDEETVGWAIGVRVYSNGKHYWFTSSGVERYSYENPDFFKTLLRIVSEEKKIDFIK